MLIGQNVMHEKRSKLGFVIREYEIDGSVYGVPDFKVRYAFTQTNDLLGPPELAKVIYHKRITPERATTYDPMCRIGFSQVDRKWYGWNSTEICGFGVGDKILEEHSSILKNIKAMFPGLLTNIEIGTVIDTLELAKQCAIAFSYLVIDFRHNELVHTPA